MLVAMTSTAPRLAGALVGCVLALSGCGSLPEESGPAGVDGLVIPTPTPDPSDFVDAVDNPWLPFTPGSTWRYRGEAGEADTTTTVTVATGTRQVQGVPVTVVEEVVTRAGGVVEESSALYAQDEEGNVWSFGERVTTYDDRGRPASEASWEAGVDGAEAGVAMLARPRVGDGYRVQDAPGEAEARATVLSLEASVRGVLGEDHGDALLVAETSSLDTGAVLHQFYARGVGLLVEEAEPDDGSRRVLVAHDPA